jgi:uncharacterized surface protein with fasciclin (FAS1) repeats
MGIFSKRKPSRRRRSRETGYQSLEQRRLLAGDVTVFQHESILYVRGDNSDNQIEISVDDFGDVRVAGTNGTTINGGETSFKYDTQNGVVPGLRVNMGRGDDFAFIEGVDVAGDANVYGGRGDDTIGLYQVDVQDDLLVQTFTGDDQVSLDEVNVGDRLVVFTLNGSDTIGIGDTDVNGSTLISTGNGDDDLAIFNSNHNNGAFIFTGGGNDFVGVDNVQINGTTLLSTGFGSDDVYINDTNFNGFVWANGGFASDRLEVDGETNFSQSPRVLSFEGNDVAGGQLQLDDVRFDLIESGARLGTITELAVLTPELSTLVGALQATGLDAALNSPGPFTVFAPLNSAFDAISDVVEGLTLDQLSDVLLFHVASGTVLAEQLVMMDSVETLLGQTFTVDTSTGNVILNGNVTLAATDIRAKNGVIHVVNEVLVPMLGEGDT